MRPHIDQKLLRGDHGACLGVLNVVTQLFESVHRIDWNHHGIGAQNCIVGNDELRAVLHVKKHPVSRLDLTHTA